MRNYRRPILLSVFCCLALAASSCSSLTESTSGGSADGTESSQAEVSSETVSADDSTDGQDSEDEATLTVEEGFLVWAQSLEPATLHADEQNLAITSWIRTGLVEGLFAIDSANSYYPQLLAGEPLLTVNNNLSVTINYTLRPDLKWSDGEPLTTEDVLYTHKIWTEGCGVEADQSIADGTGDNCVYKAGSRLGLDLVTQIEATSDTEFTIQMASYFAGWRGLYSEIYAEHAFGQDAAAVNESLTGWTVGDSPLPSAGPLLFERWDRGKFLKLVRNDAYHGSVSPDARNKGVASINGVVIDFVPDAPAEIKAILSGRGHIVMSQPQPDYIQLAESPDFTVASSAGVQYEHWGLNLLNAHLSKLEVRQALAYALDKAAVVREIYNPLFGDLLAPEGLGNTYWMPGQASYVDHQAKYAGSNLAAADAALVEAGYSKGSDGIYRHPTDGRLSLTAGTTGGNQLREQQMELIQKQMAAAGIEIIIDNVAGGDYFEARPFAPESLAASGSGGNSGDSTLWDITQFAWVGGAWPGGVSGIYQTGSASNPYGFANPEFDLASIECDSNSDDAARNACYNDLDMFVTTLDKGENGLFMLPLTQKPYFYGYRSAELSGAGIAPNEAGPLANVGDFVFNS